MLWIDALQQAATAFLALSCFRLLRYVFWCVATRGIGWVTKAALTAAYAALAWAFASLGSTQLEVLGAAVITSVYACALAALSYVASGRLSFARTPRVLQLTALVVAFVLVPAWLLPEGAVLAAIIGMEYAMSIYSYWQDVPRKRREGLGSFLFFVTVNPTMVWARRGQRVSAPGFDPSAAARLATALGAFASYYLLTTVIPDGARAASARIDSIANSASYTLFIVATLLQLLTMYAAHSALAHANIAIMRFIGHVIPERYDYPLLATSPQDFWRRWNTYYGEWLRRYVFFAGALYWGRRFKKAPSWTGRGLAVVLTFVTCGALHQTAAYAQSGSRLWSMLVFFLLSGVALVLWSAVVRVARSAVALGAFASSLPTLSAVLSWAILMQLFCWIGGTARYVGAQLESGSNLPASSSAVVRRDMDQE
jgi:hypothetical protein